MASYKWKIHNGTIMKRLEFCFALLKNKFISSMYTILITRIPIDKPTKCDTKITYAGEIVILLVTSGKFTMGKLISSSILYILDFNCLVPL